MSCAVSLSLVADVALMSESTDKKFNIFAHFHSDGENQTACINVHPDTLSKREHESGVVSDGLSGN